MRWSSVLLAAVLLAAGAPSVEEKRISIYSTVANYNLPVADREGHEYVGLLEILEPLGTVSARQERDRWKLRFNTVDADFNAGKNRSKVQGHEVDLTARFLIENGRGLVPVASLNALMPKFLGGPVSFHEASRRLFIGNVSVHFTAQIRKVPVPVLVMEFSTPVNPTIATEPGRLRMVFTREPLVPPGSNTLIFDDKTIPSANYAESNGSAEIAVNSSVPLFASFSSDRRTITIAAAPQTTPGTAAGGTSSGTPTSSISAPSTASSPVVHATGKYFAVVDASHGGDERGAALADQLSEKDVTLAVARRLRLELEGRGLPTLLLRDGDLTVTLDQRATIINSVHPAVCISVHAASQGNGVRIYTSLLPAGGENKGAFLDWNTAQSPFLTLSQVTASSVGSELAKRQTPQRVLTAPLRPLNNVATAAIAIEVAPPAGGVVELSSPAYQNLIAGAVAAGVASVREKLEAPR